MYDGVAIAESSLTPDWENQDPKFWAKSAAKPVILQTKIAKRVKVVILFEAGILSQQPRFDSRQGKKHGKKDQRPL